MNLPSSKSDPWLIEARIRIRSTGGMVYGQTYKQQSRIPQAMGFFHTFYHLRGFSWRCQELWRYKTCNRALRYSSSHQPVWEERLLLLTSPGVRLKVSCFFFSLVTLQSSTCHLCMPRPFLQVKNLASFLFHLL